MLANMDQHSPQISQLYVRLDLEGPALCTIQLDPDNRTGWFRPNLVSHLWSD